MYKRGEIILVNLNPQKNNKAGKIRACIVLSATEVNEILELLTVIPCTTNLLGEGLFRVNLSTRDKLDKQCEAMIEQIRSISHKRVLDSLSFVSTKELAKIETGIKALLGL